MNLEELRSTFINVSNTEELIETVTDKLPFDEDQFKIEMVQGSVKRFKTKVQCNVIELKDFISSYGEKTNETLRVSKTRELGAKNVYKKVIYLRCHHNTRYQNTMNSKKLQKEKPSKRFKNTDCPFTMSLKFKKDTNEIRFNCNLELE